MERQIEAMPIVNLDELAVYDPALQQRITAIQAGLSPNGHSPNGLLTNALENDNPQDQQRFINEYKWVLALAAFQYRNATTKEAAMLAAEDALFMAGETYDHTQEPNFLKHLSQTINDYLSEVFDSPADNSLPPAEMFESFVQDQQPEEQLIIGTPPPATKFTFRAQT